jgi:hypothetical protein
VTTFSTISRARLRRASSGLQARRQRRRTRNGRGRMRELRREAPPGRWHRRGAGGRSAPGRRLGAPSLAQGRCRGRAANAGRLSRLSAAGGGPPLRRTRHRATRTRPRPSLRAARRQPRNGAARTRRASPLKPAQRLSGGRLRSRQGRAYGASLRDGASATLDWAWPRVPRTP